MKGDNSLEELRKNYLSDIVYIEFSEKQNDLRKVLINVFLNEICKKKDRKNFKFSLKEFQKITGVFISREEQAYEIYNNLNEVHFFCLGKTSYTLSFFIDNYSYM